MNPKYTPATYVGVTVFVITLIVIQSVNPKAFNGHTILFLLPAAIVSGAIGGLLFTVIWKQYKKGQAKTDI
jgi:hypothetical protein